jgi:hypothetical protein
VELERTVARQARHRVRARMVRRELQLHVLPGRELDRLGGLQHEAPDVVRQRLDRAHARLDDARRVHDDLVGLRNLDRARLGHEGLAGEHVLVAPFERTLLRAAGVEHLAFGHPAAAGAAAPGPAAVGHRHLRRAQGLEQVRTRLDLDDPLQRLHPHFHRADGRRDGAISQWERGNRLHHHR